MVKLEGFPFFDIFFAHSMYVFIFSTCSYEEKLIYFEFLKNIFGHFYFYCFCLRTKFFENLSLIEIIDFMSY